jgi:hypothetical protein
MAKLILDNLIWVLFLYTLHFYQMGMTFSLVLLFLLRAGQEIHLCKNKVQRNIHITIFYQFKTLLFLQAPTCML